MNLSTQKKTSSVFNVNYLIIGQGVAGSSLALKLLQEGKSFLMIDEDKNKASSVAVGTFNPVVLKRFSLIWNGVEQMKISRAYFRSFEELLGKKLIENVPTYRIFKNPDEIETWKKKAQKPELQEYLSGEIRYSDNELLNVPYGYAEVLKTARIRLGECVASFREFLLNAEKYIPENFDYNQLEIQENSIRYKNIEAEKIVFCEGFGVKENPYFNYLPVIGVKGEVLKIETETELPKAIWKGYNFLFPENGKICLTASTYDRNDLSPEPTEKGAQEIRHYLEEIYTGNYKVLEHTAGIRPTVIDRRPILGNHHLHKNMYILNGMGTRGTLLAPQMTEMLYAFIEKSEVIDKEADVRRFDKYLTDQKN
ncbi:MAG: FAD-dependent oxidoreductase [Weeksellaceae bacterium]